MASPSDGIDCDATDYGEDGWTDDEMRAFENLVDLVKRSSIPIGLPPSTFWRVADLLTRYPAMSDDDTEPQIINALLCDPEDRRLHLILVGRKVFCAP
jgi:hypothetical protein